MSRLAVEEVHKAFGGVQALSAVSLAVGPGETVGLMGAHGAGKTTLFGIVAGHARPDRGRVIFGDRPLTGLRPDLVCRAGIARTFQVARPFPGLTAREGVAVAAEFGGAVRRAAALERADAVLEELGLAGKAAISAAALTLVDQKRLEVARALATAPRLLLLDEVMAGLTPAEVKEMVATLRSVRERHRLGILIVEHVMGALMDLAQRIVVLHHGRVVTEGTPAVVAADPRVIKAYLGASA